MMYFLWAFLFCAFGISILVTAFQSSYRPILKFSSGIVALCIGLWCISKIEMPVHHNYGKIVLQKVHDISHTGFAKVKQFIHRYV